MVSARQVIESNSDIAERAVEAGVSVRESAGDLYLEWGEATDTIQMAFDRGILAHVNMSTAKIVGLELVDYRAWALAEVPLLARVWERYRHASLQGDDAHRFDAAARLLHVAISVAIPPLAPSVSAAYRRWEAEEATSVSIVASLKSAMEALLRTPPPLVQTAERRSKEFPSDADSVLVVGPGGRPHEAPATPLRLNPLGYVNGTVKLPDDVGLQRGRYSLKLAPEGRHDPGAVILLKGDFDGAVVRMSEVVEGWRSLPDALKDKVTGNIEGNQVWKINSLVVIVVEPPDARAGSDA